MFSIVLFSLCVFSRLHLLHHRLPASPTSEASRKHAKQNEARDASMRDAKKRKFAAIGLKDKRRKLGGGGSAGGGGGRDADD